MYCPECEQLFDAYLDGQLAGTLRLEFDAHRLRCRRCQQTLAMLEAVGHVIASDTQVPELSANFTDRVLHEVEQPRPRVVRFTSPRVALVAAAIVQVAAVVTFVVVWQTTSIKPLSPDASDVVSVASKGHAANRPSEAEVRDRLKDAVEDRLWDMYAGGTKTWTTELRNIARYFDVTVPEDVARESLKTVNWKNLLPDPPGTDDQDESEPALSTDQVHSI